MSTRQEHQKILDSTAARQSSMKMQSVPVNAYITDASFVVVAPLPAVTASDVTVEIDKGKLNLKAALRSAGARDYVIQEWEYGGFEREVDVPAGFGAGLEAVLANGQLAIRVLKGDFVAKIQITPSPE